MTLPYNGVCDKLQFYGECYQVTLCRLMNCKLLSAVLHIFGSYGKISGNVLLNEEEPK